MAARSDFSTELDFVKNLATEAAAVAIARAKRVTPVEKANLSFVTDLDQDLEKLIRRRLGEQFPDDRLTGEEYAAAGGGGPRRWSIDPIDGTGNLVHGLPALGDQHRADRRRRAGAGRHRHSATTRAVLGRQRAGGLA